MIKQVIVMRKDLSMNKGKMIAQGAHASGNVILDRLWFDKDYNVRSTTGEPAWEDIYKWAMGTMTKVCVGVSSEEELMGIYEEAFEAGLPVALVIDSGKTVFHGVHTKTCLAIGPADADAIDKITGKLKLL